MGASFDRREGGRQAPASYTTPQCASWAPAQDPGRETAIIGAREGAIHSRAAGSGNVPRALAGVASMLVTFPNRITFKWQCTDTSPQHAEQYTQEEAPARSEHVGNGVCDRLMRLSGSGRLFEVEPGCGDPIDEVVRAEPLKFELVVAGAHLDRDREMQAVQRPFHGRFQRR